MAELRNVIIFAVGGARYALELRWVREVVSLGFVTGVPTAPAALGGVCNLHGAILPVLDVGALLDLPAGPAARQGDGALVIETDGVVCALRVDQVDHVASLHETDDGAPEAGPDDTSSRPSSRVLVDAGGRPLMLLDPAALVRRAQELITTAAGT